MRLAAKIIPASPTCGMVLFLFLGFSLNISPPTITIVDFGFIPFLAGFSIYAVAVVLLTICLGSFVALVRLTTPRTPSIGVYVFVLVWYGVSGLFWGAVVWSSVELIKTHTANEEITLDGRVASIYRSSTRSKCSLTAVIETNLGELALCGFGARAPLVKSLQIGERVQLLGQKNAYAFVLRKVTKGS